MTSALLLLLVSAGCAGVAWIRRRAWAFGMAMIVALWSVGEALGSHARGEAIDSALRRELQHHLPGFALQTTGPAPRHEPLPMRARLVEDAARTDDGVVLRADVVELLVGGRWRGAQGGVTVNVGGHEAQARVAEWAEGRVIEAPATFGRPARYVNAGVGDFETALALGGTSLFASVKSGLLVDVIAQGSPLQEWAAGVRGRVRRSVDRAVAPRDPVSAGIVTAILIGDRSGLPEAIRQRLQRAGTYHVIAISGGNIAVLTVIGLALFRALGCGPRVGAAGTLALLMAHAVVVTAGASVWRATAMAALYLVARLFDARSAPWQTLGVAAMLVVCARPLDVRDVGFMLTCGATGALLVAAAAIRHTAGWPRVTRWVIASVATSLAVEVVLLPVNAWAFSRVTAAGLVLNLLAVPLMALVQLAGSLVVAAAWCWPMASMAGLIAHAAASGIVESARLVDVAPWLTMRVPPPPGMLVVAYYGALATSLLARGWPQRCGHGCLVAAVLAVSGTVRVPERDQTDSQAITLTVFDVGQGDATLLELPGRSRILVDTGGTPFGSGRFDVGARVLAPALWALGVRSLERLVITHGDPDHVGGAPTIIDDFAPANVVEGVPVTADAELQAVLTHARERGSRLARWLAGHEERIGAARLRVLHPPATDWERPRVRNDDSLVLEVTIGDVAILLPGDIGADVERTIVGMLTPAPIRVLKLAHHGSRTSSSSELIEGWKPQIALVSAGRGNPFGHPADEVVQRVREAGGRLYRTDRDGQIALDTDGTTLQVTTMLGSEDRDAVTLPRP